MKRTKLVKHLHAHRCALHREGARHSICRNADGSRKTAVPRHAEIKTNTVRKICKDLDVPAPTES